MKGKQEERQPSFYAIIPADVRYDKDLTANAKLLYGELTALATKKGYSWASNQYYADLYDVSKRTITRWIGQLEEKGYIKTQLIKKEGSKEVAERRIFIGGQAGPGQKYHDPLTKMTGPPDKNDTTPPDKNGQGINTVIINTDSNTGNNMSELKPDDADQLKYPDGTLEVNLAKAMVEVILQEKPDSKIPGKEAKDLQGWATDIDRTLRIDKRDPRELIELFRWAQGDDFWVANIRSPRKLREKWDSLELQMDRDRPKNTNNNLKNLAQQYERAVEEEERGLFG